MGKFIDLTAADGFVFPAYVAEPAGKPKAAVVVLQEIFGVNSHIQAVTDRFAAQGYLAVAPATFHRVKPGVDMGYDDATIKEGIALKAAVNGLPAPGVLTDIQAAIDHAAKAGGGKVGGVEVSTDNGTSWHPATGRSSWARSWATSARRRSGTRAVAERRPLNRPVRPRQRRCVNIRR